MLSRFNRGIEGYDVDYQYQILIKVVEHEQAVAAEQKREKWYNIFRGVNGVSTLQNYLKRTCPSSLTSEVPNDHFLLDVGRTTSPRSHPILDLFVILFPARRASRPILGHRDQKHNLLDLTVCHCRDCRKGWKENYRMFLSIPTMDRQLWYWNPVTGTGKHSSKQRFDRYRGTFQ